MTNQTKLPKELQDDAALRLFQQVVGQSNTRGWALLLPADQFEMAIINRLIEAGLIKSEIGVSRFALEGNAKSADVICELTESGKSVARTLNPSTR